MARQRTVFFVSDRTGITAEALGNTLLTQFDSVEFRKLTLPFINTPERAASAIAQIDQAARDTGERPLVFSTTVSDGMRAALRACNGVFLDLFDSYIPAIEAELQLKSSQSVGKVHGMADSERYRSRIDAMNFALAHDDGLTQKDYERADVILLAPSRCGKTPTCIYMAMQHGLYAANYPLTDEDLEQGRLPQMLLRFQNKLYGLTSTAERLHRVRSERRPGSTYASLDQCEWELRQADALFRRHQVPSVNSEDKSIEEIATVIMQEKNLRRQTF
ncbi:MAG TPA: pyruvate, water dikinase regulatory protein [Candidatus Binatia bacterium]|nr:pyruvate, water dikinase regulatory protein [Candidatus Binatia bacterium]